MMTMLGAFAFMGLVLLQVLAVVFVRHSRDDAESMPAHRKQRPTASETHP